MAGGGALADERTYRIAGQIIEIGTISYRLAQACRKAIFKLAPTE
jgi:hypothetical protein